MTKIKKMYLEVFDFVVLGLELILEVLLMKAGGLLELAQLEFCSLPQLARLRQDSLCKYFMEWRGKVQITEN